MSPYGIRTFSGWSPKDAVKEEAEERCGGEGKSERFQAIEGFYCFWLWDVKTTCEDWGEASGRQGCAVDDSQQGNNSKEMDSTNKLNELGRDSSQGLISYETRSRETCQANWTSDQLWDNKLVLF